ncbi:LPXTG-site transpeptidase family protein [hydrothermal vent metagenome]|uniref:LPXTG-site transpeptidase family protein n=1 Tax=hydrothermal vent metagenome TaxID=652676 RepID=A0A3B1AFT6_9ZZZZ
MRFLSDKVLKIILFVLAIIAVYFLASAFYIPVKAVIAQNLLQSAWQSTLAGDSQVKPWPWADTWPVARLRVPGLDIDQIVLAGDQASNLAFAPGQRVHSFFDKLSGITIISAHRDTHFKFLQDVQLGQRIELQNEFGVVQTYQIEDMQIIDSGEMGIRPPEQGQWLTLVTCYPFNTINNNGSLRYVVFAEALTDCEYESCQS